MKDYNGHEVLRLNAPYPSYDSGAIDVTRLKSADRFLPEPPFQYVGEMERMSLKPDDIVVLTVDTLLSDEVAERIKKQLASAIGTDNRVIVLHGGMRLGVIGVE